MSFSGSLAFAVSCTVLSLGVQLLELVPGGHGRAIDVIEAETDDTTGGWFTCGGIRSFLRPAQNWKMYPLGSSENAKPVGKPFEVTGRLVPGTCIGLGPPPLTRTTTFVIC